MNAPLGYVAGVGRGATGFTTRYNLKTRKKCCQGGGQSIFGTYFEVLQYYPPCVTHMKLNFPPK